MSSGRSFGSTALLLDLDGTILDLAVDIEPARARVGEMFAALGVTIPMRPILQAIARASTMVGGAESPEKLVERAYQILDEAECLAAEEARARPGAVAIDRAVAEGCVAAIVTDQGAECVVPALRTAGLPGLAEKAVVISRDHVGTTKPDPEGVIRAVGMMKDAERVLFAGDSVRDMEAGLCAREVVSPVKLSLFGVAGGRSSSEELLAAGAEELLEDVGVLLTRL